MRKEGEIKATLSIILELSKVYDKVIANYRSCTENHEEQVSHAWAQAMNKEKRIYELPEMMLLRSEVTQAASNFATKDFLIDGYIFDYNDSTFLTLLEIGESDFGFPNKNVKVGETHYSSVFLCNVVIATEIIKLINSVNITQPTILDIGSGLGILLSILKGYYREQVTIFSTDLPEALLLQDWYLRNLFPDTKHVYKGRSKVAHWAEGGINLINSNIFSDQDFSFDIVINTASLQFIGKSIVNEYLSFIQKNITDNGFFFFQNNYGVSRETILEPTEYDFDEKWSIASISQAYPFETCSDREKLRLILHRTTLRYDKEVRRFILRLLWNSFNTGLISNGQPIINEVLKLQKSQALDDVISETKVILEKHQLAFLNSNIKALKNSMYLTEYTKVSTFTNPTLFDDISSQSRQSPVNSLVYVQEELILLMKKLKNHQNLTNTELRASITSYCEMILKIASKTYFSEFWSIYFAGILLSLGYKQGGTSLIFNSASNTKSPEWLVRCVQLLCYFGYYDEAKDFLEKYKPLANNKVLLIIKLAIVEYYCGNITHSRSLLKEILSKSIENPFIRPLVIQSALRIEPAHKFKTACLATKYRIKYKIDTIYSISGQKALKWMIWVETFTYYYPAVAKFFRNISRKQTCDFARIKILDRWITECNKVINLYKDNLNVVDIATQSLKKWNIVKKNYLIELSKPENSFHIYNAIHNVEKKSYPLEVINTIEPGLHIFKYISLKKHYIDKNSVNSLPQKIINKYSDKCIKEVFSIFKKDT